MSSSLRVPITLNVAKGAFTASAKLGSMKQVVNLILDTGSSTLAVQSDTYQHTQDTDLTATQYVQDVVYGLGGWYGPVINTSVTFSSHHHTVSLSYVHVALTAKQEQQDFFGADGILGLAYRGLNPAYDLTSYLDAKAVSPAVTYPYILSHAQQSVRDYRQWLHDYPREPLTPYFTQLEQAGVVADQFGLLTFRSGQYMTQSHCPVEKLHANMQNHGLLVLGEPHTHFDLYQKPIHSVKVLDDKYYNVHVCALQVDGQPQRQAPELSAQEKKGYRTNGIVDSGSSFLVLPKTLHQQIINDLVAYNPHFASLLEPFANFSGEVVGIDNNAVELDAWPDIHIYLQGKEDSPVKLTLAPSTYWQTHNPKPNQATFRIQTIANWPNQSILGLPLFNNYYTIFDRADEGTGTIHFATHATMTELLHSSLHKEFEHLFSLDKTKE